MRKSKIKKLMLIRDLPAKTNLKGLKVKTTDGIVGYYVSKERKTVFLSASTTEEKLYPIHVPDPELVNNWEVNVEDPVKFY